MTTAAEANNQDGAPSSDFIRDQIVADNENGRFDGRVQTRFPPEPNGYLHIGHAKSICLNFGLAEEFGGTCNLRFDDTNPETEDIEYVEGIIADLEWLGFESSDGIKYASDYFDQLYEWAEHLINNGLAYVDDQDAATISEQRGGFGQPGTESPFRNRSAEENLGLFRQMRDGAIADGEKVLRAKIDMQHENMQLRDPVLYRIRRVPHVRTGDTWILYPTYDWAHGQSDAIEGVTHSICTLEFADHNPLYEWCLSNLPLTGDKPYQTEFARLNLTHTVTSKRLLRKLVEDGTVDGWDDARMPTIAGLRRRGFPASAIRAFMAKIGVAKNNSTVEIELLESFVRDELNARAIRRMAVLDPILVTITNWPSPGGSDEVVMVTVANHPNDESMGTREIPFSGKLFIERDDFKLDPPPKYYRLTPGREVRLRSGFFITAVEAKTDSDGNVTEVLCTYDPETQGGQSPDGRKVKSTIHWVSAAHAVDGTVHTYDRLFADSHPGSDGTEQLDSLNRESRQTFSAKMEPSLAETNPSDVVQFERLGYFAADPQDSSVFHRTVGLRDEWANIQKRKK